MIDAVCTLRMRKLRSINEPNAFPFPSSLDFSLVQRGFRPTNRTLKRLAKAMSLGEPPCVIERDVLNCAYDN